MLRDSYTDHDELIHHLLGHVYFLSQINAPRFLVPSDLIESTQLPILGIHADNLTERDDARRFPGNLIAKGRRVVRKLVVKKAMVPERDLEVLAVDNERQVLAVVCARCCEILTVRIMEREVGFSVARIDGVVCGGLAGIGDEDGTLP